MQELVSENLIVKNCETKLYTNTTKNFKNNISKEKENTLLYHCAILIGSYLLVYLILAIYFLEVVSQVH